ncbi:MAG: DnaJ C-terminal domain-containing protein [Candidatus Nanoarchaeia archaeon]
MADKNYYDILGVDKSASKDEIKKAYKKLARKYHPDVSSEKDADSKFKEINEAAEVLLDDEKKQRYDTYGSADGPQGFGGGSGGFGGFGGGGFDPRDFGINIDDIFEGFGFGGFGGSSSSRRRQKDTRESAQVQVDLEDVYFGSKVDISYHRDVECSKCGGSGGEGVETCKTCGGQGVVIEVQRTMLGAMRSQKICPDCGGSGKTIKHKCEKCQGNGTNREKTTQTISIPKGVEDGVTLRVSQKGSYDPDSKQYGDLYIKILYKQSKDYQVDAPHLYMEKTINFIQAIMGDEIEFSHFKKTLAMKIPAGTQSGRTLRLKGKGLPVMGRDGQFGDLYVKIKVEIPQKVTSKQKELLLEYAKTMKEDKGFMSRMKKFFG